MDIFRMHGQLLHLIERLICFFPDAAVGAVVTYIQQAYDLFYQGNMFGKRLT